MVSRRLPSLTALRAFEATARHGGMRRAAAELHVTPGAVSRQVRLLEEELGRPLFIRGARGLEATPAGAVLAAALHEALGRIATGLDNALALPPARRPLTIGAYAHFASRWLIPRWGRLRAAHPDLDIALTTSADPQALRPSRFDAVIAVADPRPRPGLLCWPLVPIETVPVCAPALAGPPFDWSRQHLLHSRQRPRDWARWLAAAGIAGVDPEGGSHFESVALALDAAAGGLGVALAIRALVAPDLESGRLVVPAPFIRRSRRCFVLQQEAERAAEPGLARFRDWLLAEAGAPG